MPKTNYEIQVGILLTKIESKIKELDSENANDKLLIDAFENAKLALNELILTKQRVSDYVAIYLSRTYLDNLDAFNRNSGYFLGCFLELLTETELTEILNCATPDGQAVLDYCREHIDLYEYTVNRLSRDNLKKVIDEYNRLPFICVDSSRTGVAGRLPIRLDENHDDGTIELVPQDDPLLVCVANALLKYKISTANPSFLDRLHHGQAGKNRAEKFYLSVINDTSDRKNQVIDYLSNNTNGNHYKRSFRTILLAYITNNTNNLRHVSTNFNEILEDYSKSDLYVSPKPFQ